MFGLLLGCSASLLTASPSLAASRTLADNATASATAKPATTESPLAERERLRAELTRVQTEIDHLKAGGPGLRSDYVLRARLADAEALARRLTELDAQIKARDRRGGGTRARSAGAGGRDRARGQPNRRPDRARRQGRHPHRPGAAHAGAGAGAAGAHRSGSRPDGAAPARERARERSVRAARRLSAPAGAGRTGCRCPPSRRFPREPGSREWTDSAALRRRHVAHWTERAGQGHDRHRDHADDDGGAGSRSATCSTRAPRLRFAATMRRRRCPPTCRRWSGCWRR